MAFWRHRSLFFFLPAENIQYSEYSMWSEATWMWVFSRNINTLILIFTFADSQTWTSKNLKTTFIVILDQNLQSFLFFPSSKFSTTKIHFKAWNTILSFLSSFSLELLCAKNEFNLPKTKTLSQLLTTLYIQALKQQRQKQNSISVGSYHQDIVAQSSLLKKYNIIPNWGKICSVPSLHELLD